ncbi:MAG: hypothetical protein ACKO3T_15525 [Planctomycetaceae bacterium]
MWLLMCAGLWLQSETLTEITGQFEEQVQEAQQEHARRREQLFSALIDDLAKIQKELTREMRFDDALRVRMMGAGLGTLSTSDDRLSAVKEQLPEAPEAAMKVLQKVLSDDAALRGELKSTVSSLAVGCQDRLQKLLESESAEGDLDACLEIRERLTELRTKYELEAGLPAEFPTTEDGVAKLRNQLVEASRQRIADRLDQLGVQLSGLKLRTSVERREAAAVVLKVTKERDLEEKVKLLRAVVESMNVGKAAVRSALADIDSERTSSAEELAKVEQRLKAMRNSQLGAAVTEGRLEDAVVCYRKLQQAEPNVFTVNCSPEVAIDLPELDPECARIMDQFEAARQVEERQFIERLQPGVEELRRRLVAARAALPLEAKQLQEAVTRCRAWLESGAVDSLEEFRLIPVVSDLPESVQAGAFAEAAEILLGERHVSREAGLMMLQRRLQPELSRLSAAGDLSACVAVFVHVRWLGRRFDPQAVRLARKPWETASVGASVVDVAGRLVRVRYAGINRSIWHSRRLVRSEGEPVLLVEASAGNDDWRTADRFLPGPLVVRVSEVESGLRVFWLRGNLWELSTVSEVRGEDVTLRSELEGKVRTDRTGWRGL